MAFCAIDASHYQLQTHSLSRTRPLSHEQIQPSHAPAPSQVRQYNDFLIHSLYILSDKLTLPLTRPNGIPLSNWSLSVSLIMLLCPVRLWFSVLHSHNHSAPARSMPPRIFDTSIYQEQDHNRQKCSGSDRAPVVACTHVSDLVRGCDIYI